MEANGQCMIEQLKWKITTIKQWNRKYGRYKDGIWHIGTYWFFNMPSMCTNNVSYSRYCTYYLSLICHMWNYSWQWVSRWWRKKIDRFISLFTLKGIVILPQLPIQALCLVETTPCQFFSGNLRNIFSFEHNVVDESIDSN
jgi:hypothetical protein